MVPPKKTPEETPAPLPEPPVPSAAAPPPAGGEQVPEPRILFYLLSFFMPLAGIILGAIYLSKTDAELKKFGKNCLIAAISFILAIVALYLCMILFYVAFVFVYLIIIVAVIGAAGASSLKTACFLPTRNL
jgi:hypothetical protein